MGLPEGKIIEQAYVILLKLDKNKEVLISNDWEKREENLKNFIGSRSLLNMTLSLHHHDWVRLGYSVHWSYHHWSTIPSIFGVNATNPFHFHQYVHDKSLKEFTNPACVSSVAIPSPFILSWPPPWTLYHHIVFTSTKSFSPFRVVDVVFIKALLRRVTSCRRHLIIQEFDLGTTLSVLWSLHASMASFSLSAIGLH